ncbi:MAG: ABC transporter permease [Planktomarina sp.]
MFEVRKSQSGFSRTIGFLELLYHSTVRAVRKSGGRNVILGLLGSMMQSLTFVLAFFFMFEVLGMRAAALRGDFLLYIMSGIFVFMTHTQTLSAVMGSEGPTSPMMQHAPMNTMIAVISAAFASLYTQLLSMCVIIFGYHVIFTPVTIYQPLPAVGMVLIAWFSGIAVGMVFLAAKPWSPGGVQLASTIYQRVNMFASGKMFVANTMPGFMLAMFDWNPLFHIIDQGRGFLFINYLPKHSSPTYPLIVAAALLMIGLIGENYTRKAASASWGSRA